jgi:hypothetical protein
MLDFASVRNKTKTLKEITDGLTVADLHALTDEMVDIQLAMLDGLVDADVTFTPVDPQANDTFAATPEERHIAWTLGHVIVHTTASSEESAALAANLARGVDVKGRSRSEVPWQAVTQIAQLRQRLDESRRMRHAFLHAWPDTPHLDFTYTPDYAGAQPLNAVRRFVSGLSHDSSHLDQLREIIRQAKTARRA